MPQPFRLTLIIRIFLVALRGLVAAAVVLLLALLLGWAGLQWYVAPRLDSYRPQLVAWLGQALDADVTVQRLAMQGTWWHPVVVAQDLSINDANGEPGLQAEWASLRVSPLALLRGSASALQVQAATVWVRRDARGRLSIAGVTPVTPTDAGGGPRLRRLLLLRPGLALRQARLHWHDARDGGALTVDGVDLQLQGRGGRLAGRVKTGTLAAQLGPDLPPLQLNALAATVNWHGPRPGRPGAQVRLDDLTLDLGDDGVMDGMALALDYPTSATGADLLAPTHVRLSGLDLPMLGRLALGLPWSPGLRDMVRDWQVDQGVLQALDAQWRGPLHAPQSWQLRVQVQGLALAAVPADAGEDVPGRPGVRGLDLTFDADASGGHATLAMHAGSLSFPGIFEEPDVPVQRLHAEANWRAGDDRLRVEVPRLELSNADAEGHFSGSWRTGNGPARALGYLDLTGQLTRGDGARVHRYLPLVLPADARHYVRDAILQGRLEGVAVRVRGPLDELPFDAPDADGIFSVTGHVQDGAMAYVPSRLQDAGEPPWPVLTGLSGRLEFEGAAMRVRQASAQVQDHAGWAFADVDADIPDFDAPRVTVAVKASGSGELATALDIVRASPLAAITGHALDDATATGSAHLQLALDLPLDALEGATVRGTMELDQNTLNLRPGTPPLEAVQGSVTFSESGFALADVRARTLGGPVQLSGGLDAAQPGQLAHVKASGRAKAAGLQQWAGPAPWAKWADVLQGETTYQLSLDLAADGLRAAALDSDLKGLALALPAPLDKPADAQWPLHLRWQHAAAASGADQLELQLADRVALQWALPPDPDVAPRGTLALGAAARHPLPAPGAGFALQAQLDTLDLDDWLLLIPGAGEVNQPQHAANRWLPDRWQVTLGHLRAAGHELADLTTSGQREGAHWRGQVASPDLAGQVEYVAGQSGQAGHVVGRLSRLRVRPAAADAQPDPDTVRRLPSMDLRAEHFAWKDLDLGQLDLRASRSGNTAAPAWRVDQLLLVTPESRLQAHGNRTFPLAVNETDRGRTRFELDLTTHDAGALLQRLGQPGIMAGGTGSVRGTLAWPGSPLDFRAAALSGELQLDLADGRFLKMKPGAGRLFGILSLQALPRRLMLDFDDVFRSGWAFDRAQAHARLNRGVMDTEDLQIQGVAAAITLRGQVDLPRQALDLHLRVEPRIDASAAALAATAINPALGAAAFVAQLALRKSVGRAAARSFHVRGDWSAPEIVSEEGSPAPAKAPRTDTEPSENLMPAAGENNP